MRETVPRMKLYLASTNPGKLREFQLAAGARGVTVEPVPGIQNLPGCAEDGDTFEANARKKALHYAVFAEGPVFADDSGICVDALGGAPGVYSARYAGPGATDVENNRKLMLDLAQVSGSASSLRTLRAPSAGRDSWGYPAHYSCVVVLAEDRVIRAVVEGQVNGLLVTSPHGAGGFGYDPYFFYPPLGQTFAEISAEAKFDVSHRGIAFRKLLDTLAPNKA